MSVSYCMLTVVIWWCLCCYLLIIYCNKLYKSFCFWWWNRNEKQKYNTDISICTNKSGPFIHETEHARYMQSSTVSVRKNWLFVKILAGSYTGTWKWHLEILLAPTFSEPEQALDSYLDWKLKHISRIFCLFVYYEWFPEWNYQRSVQFIHFYFFYMISWVRPVFWVFFFIVCFCFLGEGRVRIAHLLRFLWCVFCFVSVGYILFCLYSFYVLCPMSLLSLDRSFVIAPSVVPNVYSQIMLHLIIVKCSKNHLIFK